MHDDMDIMQGITTVHNYKLHERKMEWINLIGGVDGRRITGQDKTTQLREWVDGGGDPTATTHYLLRYLKQQGQWQCIYGSLSFFLLGKNR